MPKQTADLVALILTAIVGIVVVGTAAVLLVLAVVQPEQDTTGAAEFVSRVVGILVAALVGFMAGRQVEGSPPHEP